MRRRYYLYMKKGLCEPMSVMESRSKLVVQGNMFFIVIVQSVCHIYKIDGPLVARFLNRTPRFDGYAVR